MDGKENAVVYARYSSHNQTEQSIEGQLAAAHKYAEERGYNIIHEYCDRAKTGTNDNREEFQNMLSACSSGQFSVIIVWKVDRFGRNREEITFNKYKAKKHGVRVEYIAENISDGPEGVILESVLEGMAEYFSLQLSQNVKRGLLESAKKHQVLGGHRLLGYRISPERTYEIDPVEAETVRIIFQKYAEGLNLFELMHWLNENGYRTATGGKFRKNSLPKILTNEKYTGVYIYKDIIRDEGGMPAIIGKDLFDRVQNMLQEHRRKPVKYWTYSSYLLTGKLYCGHCGSPMVGKSGYGKMKGKYDYYVCTHQLKKICQKKPERKYDIEEAVFSKIAAVLKDDEFFYKLVDAVWVYYQEQDEVQKSIERLQSELNTVETAVNNLIKSLEQGLPYDLVRARMEELEGERVVLKKELAGKQLEHGLRLTRDHIVFFLEQFRNMSFDDPQSKEKIVKVFVNAIYVSDDGITVALNYSSNNTSEFVCTPSSPAITNTFEPQIYRNVIILKIV